MTISGYVRDAASGEALINATINVSPVGATVQSNAYGYFSITLPVGKYTVNVSYTGYSINKTEIDLTASKDTGSEPANSCCRNGSGSGDR